MNPTLEQQRSRLESDDMPYSSDRITKMDVMEILLSLARRKRLILVVTSAAAVIAIVISLLLPARYTATAQIMPPQQTKSLAATLADDLGPLALPLTADLGIKSPSELYVSMLESRTIHDDLIRQFDLVKVYRVKCLSDAEHAIEDASTILAGKEGIISISVEDRDKKRAAAIANGYVSELENLTRNVAITEASKRRLFFQNQMEGEKLQLANAEAALKDTEQRTGMVHLDAQARATVESVATLRATIAAKEVELSAMKSFATEQNPDFVRSESELAALKVQLSALGSEQGDLQVPTHKIPQTALEYIRRLRDVKYHETVYEILAKQFEAAKIDEGRNAVVIQVLDTAIEPDRKSSPKRALIVIISTLAAFFVSCAFVLFRWQLELLQQDPEQRARFGLLKSYLSRL